MEGLPGDSLRGRPVPQRVVGIELGDSRSKRRRGHDVGGDQRRGRMGAVQRAVLALMREAFTISPRTVMLSCARQAVRLAFDIKADLRAARSDPRAGCGSRDISSPRLRCKAAPPGAQPQPPAARRTQKAIGAQSGRRGPRRCSAIAAGRTLSPPRGSSAGMACRSLSKTTISAGALHPWPGQPWFLQVIPLVHAKHPGWHLDRSL
jgi:hypothetical protein